MENLMKTSIQMLSGAAAIMTVAAGVAVAQQLTVEISEVTDAGVGENIGTVAITEDRNGTAFKVAVSGIPAGKHGFHVHEKGNCAAAMKDGKMEPGGAAGAHYDPEAKKSHKGPQGAGHKGDLPALTANATGVNETVMAPKLKLSEVQGRALVIHAGGDNYSDRPCLRRRRDDADGHAALRHGASGCRSAWIGSPFRLADRLRYGMQQDGAAAA
jgi:superoxide dismutase, Cu-Zn family